MVTKTVDTYPVVVPMICYEDCVAALDWLVKTFGFRERERLMEPGGRVGHAELETGGGVIMLGSGPEGYESPATRSARYERIRQWSAVPWVIDGILVYVDDVDSHHQRAKQAGA